MRIATFNLENLGGDLADGARSGERISALRPELVRLNADILCLQEINAEGEGKARRLAAFDALLDGTQLAGFHRAVTTSSEGSWPRDVHNLVTLSRYPIRAQAQVLHDLVAPPHHVGTTSRPRVGTREIHWDRPILHTEIEAAPGRFVHVINVHLRAPLSAPVPGQKISAFSWASVSGWAEGFYLAALKRNGQALETRLLIDSLFDANEEALIVVCGDFNSADREVPVATVRGDLEDTGNPALAARVMGSVEEALPESSRFTVRHAGREIMFDHILASPGLLELLEGAMAYNADLPDELTDSEKGIERAGSHHAPLAAQFRLPG